jgi:hypothetical protein
VKPFSCRPLFPIRDSRFNGERPIRDSRFNGERPAIKRVDGRRLRRALVAEAVGVGVGAHAVADVVVDVALVIIAGR